MGGAATQLTESVMQFVANMRGDLLGSIGLAFLVYTVITTIQKVETSFNFVWRVERPRSFVRRFTEYLSVMIIGPILLAVAIGPAGERASTARSRSGCEAFAPLAWTSWAPSARSCRTLIVTVVFTFMYIVHPQHQGAVSRGAHRRRDRRHHLGAGRQGVHRRSSCIPRQLVAVYTGFAIVLTTLIWVYLSWLILLIGAQLAFYVQFPQYLRHGQESIELTRQRSRAGRRCRSCT